MTRLMPARLEELPRWQRHAAGWYLRALYEAGWTSTELAEWAELSPLVVRRMLRDAGTTLRPARSRPAVALPSIPPAIVNGAHR